MHRKETIHRDIKPANIFLGYGSKIKIGDFGISRVLNENHKHTLSKIGSPNYVAPELLIGKNQSKEVDLWAIGCVIYELCYLKKAFSG
jgi:serine/threonine protein kinase